MGQSTEELSGDIAQTRQSMTANVDALQDRVSPAAIVERRKTAARGRIRGVRDKVMGTAHGAGTSASGTAGSARDSASGAVDSVRGTAGDAVSTAQDRVQGTPLAAGLVAFGAGMIVSALIPASEKEAVAAGHAVDAAKEHGQPVVDQARSVAQDVAAEVKETATQAAQEVKESAAQSADKVKSEGQSGVDEVRSQTSSS
jgi:vacuolar-type H+-ATPase subunit H